MPVRRTWKPIRSAPDCASARRTHGPSSTDAPPAITPAVIRNRRLDTAVRAAVPLSMVASPEECPAGCILLSFAPAVLALAAGRPECPAGGCDRAGRGPRSGHELLR